jgi:hypothetical protein
VSNNYQIYTMKKYLLFLTMLGLSSNFSFAQEVRVSEEVLLKADARYEIIGAIGDRVLLFREEASEFILQSFDEQLKIVDTQTLKNDFAYRKYIGSVAAGNYFTLLFSHRDKGETHVKAHRYDARLQLLDSTTIRIFERRAFAPSFKMHLSENRNFALLYNVEKERYLETFVFDLKNFKTVWEYTFDAVDFYYPRNFIDFLVDNTGGAHLVIEHDNERATSETNRFEFMSFAAGATAPTTYILPLQEYIWYDVRFSFDNLNQKITAGGLISNEYKSKTLGYFYLSIDPKDETNRVFVCTPFTDAFVQDVLGREKSKKREGFAEVDIREIVLRSDGGLLLVLERNYSYVRQSAAAMTTYTYRGATYMHTDYYYNNLLVLSIHPTGALHWQDILHKRQYSQDDEAMYSSYFLLKTKNQLRFLYNDEVKQGNPVHEYVLTGGGLQKRNNILNTQGTKLMLVFRDALQVSADEVVIPSEFKRQLRLVKLGY